jgi:hypothetical protein
MFLGREIRRLSPLILDILFTIRSSSAQAPPPVEGTMPRQGIFRSGAACALPWMAAGERERAKVEAVSSDTTMRNEGDCFGNQVVIFEAQRLVAAD